MGFFKKRIKRIGKRVKKTARSVKKRRGGFRGIAKAVGKKRGLAGLAGKKAGKRIKRIKKRRGGFLGKILRKRGGIGALASKGGRRGGFLKKLRSSIKKRKVNTFTPQKSRGPYLATPLTGPRAPTGMQDAATQMQQGMNQQAISPEKQQQAMQAAQSRFMGPQVTPQMQQAATQMQQGMNQPAVSPDQAQAAALAAQSQFMAPQVTPEMQQAATQMQQGMNQGTNEGGFAGDPYDDPIKYTGQDMTPQETQRLGDKMRAHSMRMSRIKPPMDISVAEPAGQQAPSGLQDFMNQKIDPRQQAQFANMPSAEQFKYMQGMGGSQMGPRVPQPPRNRAILYANQGMGGPQPFQMGPQQGITDEQMNMGGRRAGGIPDSMRPNFGPQPFQMRPQQPMSDFERQEMEMNGRRAGPRGSKTLAYRQRPMPRGLRRAPSRGMMGMFGGGRFGGGGGNLPPGSFRYD